MTQEDRPDIYQGLIDGFLWAECPLDVDGDEPDFPEDTSYLEHGRKTGKPLVLDTHTETVFANAAYAFVEQCMAEGLDPLKYASHAKVGIDLWLSASGHGTGFWDGDYGDIGDRLTEIAGRCIDGYMAGGIDIEDDQLVVQLD